MASRPLVKLSRSDQVNVRMQLHRKQKGICPLCLKQIDMTGIGVKADFAVDHDHETGEIRALLHKSCNSAEGKIIHAAGSWGAKSHTYEAVIPFLERLLEYYKRDGTGMMYWGHKTPEEKKEAQRIKNNKAAALRRAKARVAGNAK